MYGAAGDLVNIIPKEVEQEWNFEIYKVFSVW